MIRKCWHKWEEFRPEIGVSYDTTEVPRNQYIRKVCTKCGKRKYGMYFFVVGGDM